MKKEVSFIGSNSGDGECFCWLVDFDTYKKFDSHWDMEIKWRQENNVDNGNDKDFMIYDKPWQLHPGNITRYLDSEKHDKKYKITIIMEEVEE